MQYRNHQPGAFDTVLGDQQAKQTLLGQQVIKKRLCMLQKVNDPSHKLLALWLAGQWYV